MSNRLLIPAVVLSLAAGCNRGPAPTPEKTAPDQVVPSYQAATPASAASPGASPNNVNSAANGASPDEGNSVNADGSRAARAGTTPENEALSDAQIARITNDANATEIEQGKLARTRAKDARVKAFAERMVKHHTDAKDKQAKLKLDTAESALSTKLEKESGTTTSALQGNTSANFDQEYIQAQIKEHQEVLDTIDKQLLPNAKNDDLKSYLKEIRPTVVDHLKDARDIEAKLTQQASTSNQSTTAKRAGTASDQNTANKQGSSNKQAAIPQQ